MRHLYNSYFIVSLVLLAGIIIISVVGIAQQQNNDNHSPSDTSYWQTQTTSISGTYYALSAVDENVCWLAGASGKIILTIDGGASWSAVNSGIINAQDIHVFEGVSDSIAFTSTTLSDTTYIYRTTDCGSLWTKVFSQHRGSIDRIKMFNQTKGIALGEPVDGKWTILKTANGGETWNAVANQPPQSR